MHPCSDFKSATDGDCRNWVEPQPGARNRFEPFCALLPDKVCITDGRPWKGRMAPQRAEAQRFPGNNPAM